MIPELPLHSTDDDMMKFYDSILTRLETASEHHKYWHTHKRENGVYCWICDVMLLCRIFERELERFISKSSLDYTTVMSEKSLNLNNAEESVNEHCSTGDV